MTRILMIEVMYLKIIWHPSENQLKTDSKFDYVKLFRLFNYIIFSGKLLHQNRIEIKKFDKEPLKR